MNERDETTVAVIGCAGLLPALVLSCVLKAWAVVTLWGWFVTPTWGITAPKYAVCLGISALAGVLMPTPDVGSKSGDESVSSVLAKAYSKLLLSAPFAVGFGWIVRHWM